MHEAYHQLLYRAAEEFGTPLYVYDQAVIEEKYFLLKDGCATDIFYSLKANPNLAIATTLKKCGAGAEVCSETELKSALKAGFTAEQIIFVGPLKKPEDIATALEHKIYAIVCESKQEFELIDQLAKTREVVANVAIRINPEFSIRDASLKMGGVPSQFGIDKIDVLKHKQFFLDKNNINIKGIHVFNGTRILRADAFYENCKEILRLSDELSCEWKFKFSMVDLGGGIGVPYFNHEEKFDMTELKKMMHPLIENYQAKYPEMRIIIESGRYLVADAGVFISRIDNVKESRGVSFLITDGGMNCHLTAAGYGSFLKRNFPIQLLTKNKSNQSKHYHITGPLCTPADVIGRAVELPLANAGDCIAIFASGAYGATASPTGFLGHGHPAEVLMNKKKMKLIRERDNTDDFLRKQVT